MMPKAIRTLWVLVFIATLSQLARGEAVDNEQALEAELIDLKKNLQQVESDQSSIRADQQVQNRAIRALDEKIARIVKRLRQAEKAALAAQTQTEMLQQHKASLEIQRDQKKALIKEHVLAASRLGKNGMLRVLLNQEDPNQVSRMAQYYRYLASARLEQVAEFEAVLTALNDNEALLAQELQTLQAASSTIILESDALKVGRAELANSEAALRAAFATAEDQRKALKLNESNLIALLEQIRRNTLELPNTVDFESMVSRRGQLDLPISGDIRHRFGERKLNGRVRWDGLMIEAPSGTKVKAIHYGRVVFADWLRGFGLLIILRHSDGFMSLYGHNQVLYPEVGDWVVAGQTISE
ncbi:MAG: peptidoglycan DD-metalloendopeptidase family protein, partial [Proteobacteria bacterium]|nr:peptidoglycan DD-metalloendopeptidase family protein [Pseudomonadota bacterium]